MGGFLIGQFLLSGVSWERVLRQSSSRYFREEVSLNFQIIQQQ